MTIPITTTSTAMATIITPATTSTPSGLRGFVASIFRPHSHDSADSVDTALEGSAEGIKAVKLSLLGLGVTALLQVLIVVISGSVALLADTIHNFGDAVTAVPLGSHLHLQGGLPAATTPTATAAPKTWLASL